MSEKEIVETLNNFKSIQILYGDTFTMHINDLKKVQEAIEGIIAENKRLGTELDKTDSSLKVALSHLKATHKYATNLEQENKELKEYKRIAELTKITCCNAQNCEALNNSIKYTFENTKLKKMLEEVKKAITYDRMEQLDDYVIYLQTKYLEILGENNE